MIKSQTSYSISIILPILNEIKSLEKTIKILEKTKVKKEYLVIYSKKLTNKNVLYNLKKYKKRYKNLNFFPQKKPFVGGAIDYGIKMSSNKYIAVMASDLEANPHELKKMIALSKKNPNHIISADRWVSQKGFSNYGFIKFLANYTFQKLIKVFVNYEIFDFTFAYRLYPKKALKRMNTEQI